MNTDTVTFYEELSMNAHPALKTQLYDGWVLRFSNGYTNRANSVNPIYPSCLPIEEKVAFCEQVYGKQGLPAVFKLNDASPVGLDAYLDARGYKTVTPTMLMINNALSTGSLCGNVDISNTITPSWQEDYFRLNGLVDPKKTTAAIAMMENIQNGYLCARIIEGGAVIACGLCVMERGFAGLFDIVVDAERRRQGYGFALCNALLTKAAENGAGTAYLQVVEANVPAVELYTKLGYHCHYRYWYRVK